MRQQHIITAMLIGWQLHQGAAALGAIWTVDDDGDADFNSIQAAVDEASHGDEVVVEPGTYTSRDLFVVDMAGKRITLRASSSFPAETIIDGEGVRGGIICFTGENKDTVIDGFTITRGSKVSGGGVLCNASSPTLRNCIITGNTAITDGGGVYCFDGDPILESCLITNNEAEFGGGVWMWHSNPKMTQIQISDNVAAYGAGMRFMSDSKPRLAVCQIVGNIASNSGGGIHLSGSSPVLSGCTITNNTSGGDGGGISSEFGSHPVLASCLISGNTSANDGGGFFSPEELPSGFPNSSTLSDCTITMNFATRFGGGIYRPFDKEMILSISTVCGNNPEQIRGDFTNVDSAIYYKGCLSECVGDVDANGTIDIHDLLPVLENWGVCP